jgi:hypothetical protein
LARILTSIHIAIYPMLRFVLRPNTFTFFQRAL